MKTMDDEPNHPLFGKNMKMMQNKYKERKFQIVMDEVIEDLVHVFPKEVLCVCVCAFHMECFQLYSC